MGPRRRLIVAGSLVAVAAAGWLAVPQRFAVDGVSMGPALLPGDVVGTGVFPVLDRLRRPRRFERWVLAAADGLALKRVVGLPDEEVSLADGDLAIDGEVVLKGPRLLTELGCTVADGAGSDSGAGGDWTWARPAGEILDDAPFDPTRPQVLAGVRDAGLAAIVNVQEASASDPTTVRIRVGDAVLTEQLAEPGHHAVVAGRLDGRIVRVAWRVPAGSDPTGARTCLPVGAPAGWQVAEPWPGDTDEVAPALAIGPGADGRATVVAVSHWRDVAYRPAADGRTSWRLGADQVFVLGDHPPASTDSRRWGPVQSAALRFCVTGQPR